ncbi:MAG: efflux RND transporter permease subunit [Planctomycetota bacterium]|nr:MAG: efflux RND transporter permease subunit [Planctomycetota bacterium]
MQGFIRAAIGQSVVINVIFVGLILCAVTIAVPNMAVDRFPNIAFGEVEITTPYPGGNPEEVESLVTREIEDALRDMQDIEWIRGSSRSGRSTVRVKFDDDTDYSGLYDELRLRVLAIQNRLPVVNDRPLQPRFNLIDVDEWLPLIQVNITATPGPSPLDQRALSLLGEDLRSRLERLPGVKKVDLMGDQPQQFELVLRPDALQRHGVDINQVAAALRASGRAEPAGSIDTPLGERIIRVENRYRSIDDMASVVVRRDGDGTLLTVGDLVNLTASTTRPIPGSVRQSISGRVSVGAKVLKTPRSSALRVKDAVVAEVDIFVAGFDEPRFEIIYSEDNTIEIRDGMGVLAQSLLLSVVLVMVLLFLFLANRSRRWNVSLMALGLGGVLVMLSSDSGLVTALCIGGLGTIILLTCRAAVLAVSGVVFSFLGALLIFWIMGQSLNEITLLGFILVSGIIVDDAIIVIENIQRHREQGKPLLQAAVDGCAEVFLPVVSAALTTAFAFLPMLMMTGAVGEFFALVPIAVTTALLISLVEALIILPLHVVEGERLLGPDPALKRLRTQGGEGAFMAALRRAYDRLLRYNLHHPKACLSGAGLLFVIALGILIYSSQAPRYGRAPIIRSEFFPEDLSVLMLTMRGPMGTSITATDERGRALAGSLHDMGRNRILTVTTFAGMTLDTTYKPVFANNRAVMMVKLPPRGERDFADARAWMHELRSYVRENWSGDGWSVELRPAPTGPPTGMPVNVRVSGSNDTAISALADDLFAWMQQESGADGMLPGVSDLSDDRQDTAQQLAFQIDRQRASIYGVSEQQIGSFLVGASEGLYVGEFRRHDGDIPLRLRLPEAVSNDPAALMDVLIVDDAQGRALRFADLGTLEITTIPANRERRDFQRTITITGDLDAGSPLSASHVVRIIQDWYRPRAAQYPGASLAFGGEAESTARSYQTLAMAFVLALVLIYAVLSAQFQSFVQPLLILSNVAFSFTGVVLLMGGLGILGQVFDGLIRPERTLFTVNSFIAIIGLSGLVVNGGIVLMDFINRRLREGLDDEEAIITAAHQRLRPIILTTLTTMAGLLPMAVGLPDFSVTWGPFATSFIGGLAVSSAMTLLVLPPLVLIFVRMRRSAQQAWLRYHPASNPQA